LIDPAAIKGAVDKGGSPGKKNKPGFNHEEQLVAPFSIVVFELGR
jgi:hypothetical protein